MSELVLSSKIYIEFYPNGEAVFLNEEYEIIAGIGKEVVIGSMLKNAAGCDWLSKKDLKQFAKELLRACE